LPFLPHISKTALWVADNIAIYIISKKRILNKWKIQSYRARGGTLLKISAKYQLLLAMPKNLEYNISSTSTNGGI
jgi:hypothetical protein